MTTLAMANSKGEWTRGVPLYGHLLASVEGARQHDAAESAVAQLVQQLVSLHGRVLHAGNVQVHSRDQTVRPRSGLVPPHVCRAHPIAP